MPNYPKQQHALLLFFYVATITLLLLSALNIENYLKPNEVLGTEIESTADENFWNRFLEKNPNYIPGWIEIGRFDRVMQIDPNYPLP